MQLLVRLGLDATGYETGLKKAQSSAAGFGQDLKSHIGGKIKQAFSLESIEENIRRTVEYGGKVQDLSQRLGISTDAVQQWDYAMQQNGGSIESVAGFFEKLAVAREKALKGNSQAIDGFRKLGVSMDQLRTGRLEDIATTISRAFEQGDPQQLIAPLREVGGKAAGELIPAFRDGLAAALSEAPLISPKDIEALDRAGDKWTALMAEVQTSIAPAIAALADAALGIIDFARKALAIPVGALLGMVESYKKAWSEGGTFGVAKNFVSGFVGGGVIKGGFEGAKEAVAAVDQQQKERDNQAEARRNKPKKPIVDAESDDKKADKKAQAKEAAELNKIQAIHERIEEIRRRTGLIALTDAAKLKKIEEEIAAAQPDARDTGLHPGLKDAEREEKLAKLEEERARLKGGMDKTASKNLMGALKPEHNSLIDIGNYLGAGSNVGVEGKLDLVHEDLREVIRNTASSGTGSIFPNS